METASKNEGKAGCMPGTTEYLMLKPSNIHGMGGFARVDIPAGARVIEYVGRKVTKAESLALCEANNQYIFALDDEYDLDGNVDWNPARLVNHSCDPNCEATVEDGRVWIVAVRDIRVGEEITFNYGYDLEDYREYPCCCGARGCVGYMLAEDLWDYLPSSRS